ncbi:MAG: M23 family peptidase, partial [Pedobacter sp.]
MKKLSIIIVFLASLILFSCKSGPFNLIKPATPHQAYERKLKTAGLDQTIMGAKWINNAQQSLQKALAITLPYQEKGYFSAEKIEAVAYRFQLNRGQKLQVKLDRKPINGFMIYFDLWEPDGANYKLLAAADTLGSELQLDAEKTGTYILRLQPELLGSGSYTIVATTGPSLAFPLKSATRNSIKSLWGVGRDNDTRKHEGIDIFAPFRT